MFGVFEHAKEDESACYAGVETPDKDNSRDHERIRHLLVKVIEDSKGWRNHVLVASVSVNDRADDAEGDDLGASACPQCFGKVTVEIVRGMTDLPIDAIAYRGSRISAMKLGMVV
jgi:hypothetical protein